MSSSLRASANEWSVVYAGRGRQPRKKMCRKLPGRPSKSVPSLTNSDADSLPPPSRAPPLRAPSARPAPSRRQRGRIKRGKPKKPIKITGLDLLHSETILSTESELHLLFLPSLINLCLYRICSFTGRTRV